MSLCRGTTRRFRAPMPKKSTEGETEKKKPHTRKLSSSLPDYALNLTTSMQDLRVKYNYNNKKRNVQFN
jgi:hypothetical protein